MKGWTFKKFQTFSFIYNGSLKILCLPHQMVTNSHYIWKSVSVDASWLMISTGCFKNSLTLGICFHLFLVSYLLNLLLFSVSYGGGCSSTVVVIERWLVSHFQYSMASREISSVCMLK
jgi:hypothetical protein